MRYFDVDINIKEEDIKWMFDLGNNITEPAWTIRPHKLTTEEMQRILPITGQFSSKTRICSNNYGSRRNRM